MRCKNRALRRITPPHPNPPQGDGGAGARQISVVRYQEMCAPTSPRGARGLCLASHAPPAGGSLHHSLQLPANSAVAPGRRPPWPAGWGWRSRRCRTGAPRWRRALAQQVGKFAA